MNLAGCAEELQHRLIHIFGRDEDGRRAVNGGSKKLDKDPYFRDYVHFYEFFNGDDGRGLGASHQTGWTGVVAWLIHRTGEYCRLPKTPKSESIAKKGVARFLCTDVYAAPRSMARHYFDDNIQTPSEYGPESSLNSAYPESEWCVGVSGSCQRPLLTNFNRDQPEPEEL